MNILITDYHCASNRGDAAIFEGVYQSIKSEFEEATIDTMTEFPESAELIHGIDALPQTLANFQWSPSKKNAARLYLSGSAPLLRRDWSPPFSEYVIRRADTEPYQSADLVVSTGGHFLTDEYFPGKIGVLWEHFFLTQLGTPVVLFGQSLGPFTRKPYREFTRYVLNRVDLIITRDRQSQQMVENLGVSTPCLFTADPAFSMDLDHHRNPPLEHMNSLPEYNDNKFKISFSIREWRYTDESTSVSEYISSVAKVTEWLVKSHDCDVIFASTCTGLGGYHTDDRVVATKVVKQISSEFRDNVKIMSGEYTPSQLVEIYDMMDFHIGMRMHSNILAMLAGTPVVAIQYQFKTKGLLEMFELEDFLIDVNGVNFEGLKEVIQYGLDNRSYIEKSISRNLSSVKRESNRSAKELKSYWKQADGIM